MKPTKRVKGLLLYPGAGSDSTHSSLIRIEEQLRPLPVRRADFSYRIAGRRRAPDRAPVLLAAVRAEALDFARTLRTTSARLVLGGRSMGGRMCSIAVAGDGAGVADADGGATAVAVASGPPLPAAGLILVAYPLHPPGRPDNLRTEHLPRLGVPCLFVSGTRDPFGTPHELERWTATIPAPVTHVWLDGRGHDLRGADDLIASAVTEWMATVA